MVRFFLAILMAVAISSCAEATESRTATYRHTDNGVSVELDLTVDANGDGVLAGTFAPTDDGWHLYSTDLSMDGVDGIGRPTQIEFVSGASASGPVTESAAAYDLPIETLNIVVPVYPDGPITLTIPVEDAEGEVDVSLTYMSCSADGGCRIPVVGRQVTLTLSGEREAL